MHLLTQSALLRALGWSLFNSLWQMSLLWAFYHLFLLVFKKLPARARHGLALLLLIAGLCWSVSTFIGSWWAGGNLPALGTTGVFPGTLSGLAVIAGEILPWCSSLYLLILAGLLVYYGRQYIGSKHIVREGISPLTPELDAFVATAAERQGIRPTVKAYLSELTQVPVTLGFLKPVILLPVSILTQLTTNQIEAILIHELAHIRRKDYLLNLLITVVGFLYFFNPFTRALIAELKKEREHCCDDAVLEYQYDPHGYVSALLSLARHQQQASLALAASGGGEQLLLQRARKILQQKRSDPRVGFRLLMGFLLTALIPVLFLGHPRPAPQWVPGSVRIPQSQRLVFGQPIAPARLESMSFVIVNTPPPQPANARNMPAPHVHHRPAHAHLLAKHPSEEQNNLLTDAVPVFNTADEFGDVEPVFTDLMTETASRSVPAKRDFSMGKPNPKRSAPTSDQDDQSPDITPFVPQSSFSFQYIDTLPPGEKLAMMQELSQEGLILEIAQMQQDLKRQMQLLRNQRLDTKALRQLLQQQLQIQRRYMLNLRKLQLQLQKSAGGLTIVYI